MQHILTREGNSLKCRICLTPLDDVDAQIDAVKVERWHLLLQVKKEISSRAADIQKGDFPVGQVLLLENISNQVD